jgi:hypothetical protein
MVSLLNYAVRRGPLSNHIGAKKYNEFAAVSPDPKTIENLGTGRLISYGRNALSPSWCSPCSASLRNSNAAATRKARKGRREAKGVTSGRNPKVPIHQRREAIQRRDKDG